MQSIPDSLDLLERYGNYQQANIFALNDQMSASRDLESVEPLFSPPSDASNEVKRHSACDACRKRKLKCSGEPSGCSRCTKQMVTCRYSDQKQMGRPRKKQKTVDTSEDSSLPSSLENRIVVPQLPRPPLAYDPDERAAFESICNGPFTQHVKKRTSALRSNSPPRDEALDIRQGRGSLTTASDSTPASDSPRTPPPNFSQTAYPTDFSQWPDFSTMQSLPMIVQDNHEAESRSAEGFSNIQTSDPFESFGRFPATPDCPCLPNMYLTLSTLSTSSSFPLTSHTIETLQTTARTARSVLYCSVCPQKFQTGIQNVMLLGTLLTVLADSWHRIQRATPEEVRRGFRSGRIPKEPLTPREDLQWRTFTHRLVRANVFGDSVTMKPPCEFGLAPTEPSSTTHLSALVEGMERRQSQWHHPETQTGEFARRVPGCEQDGYLRGMTLEQIHRLETGQEDFLCLKLVGGARAVMQALDQEAPKF